MAISFEPKGFEELEKLNPASLKLRQHRAHILAPLLASACRAAAMMEAEMEPFRTADIVWRAVKQEGDRATGVIDLSDQLQVLSIFLIHYHQTMLLTSVTLRLPRSHSSCARHQA